jgi:hypothetical protein
MGDEFVYTNMGNIHFTHDLAFSCHAYAPNLMTLRKHPLPHS